MDFAIGLSLVNGISGQINQIVGDFRRLDGVTDEVMKQLSGFKNISIAGGLLAGAGIKGLQATADILEDCVNEAATLQSTSLDLKIAMFGDDLLEQSKLPEIEAKMAEIEGKAMDISLNTVFNQNEIEQSMLALSKGGMSTDFILESAAEANAKFAEVVGSKAADTADATVRLQAGFQLAEEQMQEGLDWLVKYADSAPIKALPLQEHIGVPAATAMNLWGSRDNMTNLKETMELMAVTAGVSGGGEDITATRVRSFLDVMGKSVNAMTEKQVQWMEGAGWLTESGESIFLDPQTGSAINIETAEKILESAKERLSNSQFSNLVDIIFGERGKITASALAKKSDEYDVLTVRERAARKNTVDTRAAELEQTASFQMGILEESIHTLQATIGKPFLEPIAQTLQTVVNPALKQTADFFRNHPEITKYMAAIAAGASAFLILAGSIMMAIGLVGSFKLIWAKAGAQIIAHFAPILSTFGVVTAVIAVIAGLAFVVYRHWGTFQPMFASIWENVKQILASVKESFINFANSVKPIISGVLEVLEVAAFAVALVVLPAINAALMILAGILNGNVVQAFQNAWSSMGIFSQMLFVGVSALLIYKGVMLAVSIATKIWSVAQGILNVIMTANPIGLVIVAIAGLIAVIAVIITHFKEFTEWVQKGWDKLKNFLGFKNEHKEELEAPVNVGVEQTEQINKVTNISTIADTSAMVDVDMTKYDVAMDGVINPEITVSPDYQVDYSHMEEMKEQLKGLGENTFDFGSLNCTMPDMTGNLEEIKNAMQTGGTEAGNAFANALEGTSGAVAAAMQNINGIIQSTLLNSEQMFLWGSNLIQSFINGMNSQKIMLMMTAASLASTVGDYLKVQSPSRKGELKTNHLWGGNLIQSFAEGMKGKQGLLEDTSALLATQTSALNGIEIENWRKKDEKFTIKNRAEKTEENQKEQRPIYIVIQGAEKRENEIAQEVAKELDKRGYGKRKREKSPSLTMSPYGFLGGY